MVKPLYGIKDPYCATSSHLNWEYYATVRDLLTYIQNRGSNALKIKGIRVYDRDRSGRAIRLQFTTDAGPFVAQTSDLRKVFGTYDVRSTYITRISPQNGGYEFYGKGWGHGVGMCQDGAKGMALSGKNYKRILRHYYPGALIEKLPDRLND